MAERSLSYYTEFCEFKYKLKINSVIKGRHESTEKQTLELLEVSPDEDNKIDKRAFCVHPVIPGCLEFVSFPDPREFPDYHGTRICSGPVLEHCFF